MGRIEIEQVERSRWVAEVEAGFPISRREHLRAATFGEIVEAVRESYERMTGTAPRAVSVVHVAHEPFPATVAAAEPHVAHATAEDDIDALRQRAAELGVDVDNRWGTRRLRAEIDAARERAEAET